MKSLKNFAIKLWKDESGQGTAEYILLLVVVIAIAALFRTQIMSAVRGKLDEVGSGISNFSGDGG